MRSDLKNDEHPKWMLWTSYILSALPALLLLFSATMKFVKPPGFAEGLAHMGWDEGKITYIGIVEIACTILYLIPQTSILGAILLTAYMGGAIATHVRVGDPFIMQVLVGVVIWAGVFMRDSRLRLLIPFRKT